MIDGADERARCKVRQEVPEVLYADQPAPELSRADIDALVREGQALKGAGFERGTIRLCTHRTVEDPIHEMMIVHSRRSYIPPHKHLNKSESSYIIEGMADLVLFNDDGSIAQVVRMGDYASGRSFYFRLSEPIFHTMLVRSERVIFHEITNGPFRREDCIFASFAPARSADPATQASYLATLIAAADKFT